MSTKEATQVKSIEDMTLEEIEAFTAKKRKAKVNQLAKEKAAYEEERNYKVNTLFDLAEQAHDFLADVKKTAHIEMEAQAEALNAYGKMRSNSKGGFSIENDDKTIKITRMRDTQPVWDERSKKGVELLKTFLAKTAKKRDEKLYNILMSFLEKNSDGDLEYARVMMLLQHEDKFDAKEWHEGIRLVKEGYSNNLKGYGYLFKFKDASGKYQTLNMNFSSL